MSLTTSLVELWKLDEASGNALGTVSSSNDLTAVNSPGSGTGVVSNCRTFANASERYFTHSDSASLSTGDIDFSFSVWVNLASKTTIYFIFGKDDGVSNREYSLVYYNSDRFRFRVSGDGSTSVDVFANTFGSPSTGVWYFITCGHDSVNNNIWISVNNGPRDTTSHSAGVFDGTAAFEVGNLSGFHGAGFAFDGSIDELAFWKKTLSTTEQDDLYNDGYGLAYSDWGKPDSPSAELTTSLTSYWSMEGGSGASESDQTATGNTLTSSGTVGSAAGKVSNCRTFTKFGAINLNHADNASLSCGDIDAAWAAWVKCTAGSWSSDSTILGKGDIFGTLEYWLEENNSDGRFEFRVGSTIVKADNQGSPSVSTWYFIVAWHDPTKNLLCICANAGTPNTTSFSSGITDGTGTFRIGAIDSFGSAADGIDGNIDEVGFWKRRLYPWERRWLYNSGSGRAYSDFAGSAAVNSVPWQRRHRRVRNLLRM